MLFPLLAFAALHSVPTDAAIVDSHSTSRMEPIGNVLVIFADGHRERWTRQGGCLMVHVSDTGLVGWVRAQGIYPTLRVCWPDGHHRDILEGDYPYLDAWDFIPGENAIGLEVGFNHGPRHFIKCDVTTGKMFEIAAGQELPAWAQKLDPEL